MAMLFNKQRGAMRDENGGHWFAMSTMENWPLVQVFCSGFLLKGGHRWTFLYLPTRARNLENVEKAYKVKMSTNVHQGHENIWL